MQPFTQLTAICAPFPQDNVNTDDIYPGPGATPLLSLKDIPLADRLRPENMKKNAFSVLRWNPDGSPRPEFVLNQPPFDRAQILLTGANFGCGSSREHAVWCLLATGIRCVIAPSFGDIFYNNCFKNGMLAIRLAPEELAPLQAVANSTDPQLTIDLDRQTVTTPAGHVKRFEIDAYKRNCLLKGLDEIGATLEKMPEIEQFESSYLQRRPWLA
jgi:3-isopropylmalate/(R)-2-methylmalate dehydratase small subunit